MNEYHKIQTVFLRDPESKHKYVLEGNWALPEFEYLKDCQWIWTEKVDGTNIRVIWDCLDKNIEFRGKTDKAQTPIFLLEKLNDIFFVQRFEQLYPETSMCLYGEGYGAKIQKGGGNYISDGVSFVLFDVKIGDWWLKREDVEDITHKLNIDIVPIVGHGTLPEMMEKVKNGFVSAWATQKNQFIAEGIVARPMVELKSRNGQRIITKLKTKDFKNA